jgi:soluble lytic murein transglycosylase-like protein
MPIFCRKPSVSLFNRERLHSCVPSKIDTFGGRSVSLGWPLRRPPSVSPWKKRLTAASLPRVGTVACLITTIVLGCVSCSFVAAARKSILNGAATTYNRWASYVAEASSRFGVPAHWIRAVMQLESTGDKGAVSPKGAMGLMQVMPETYAELRLRYHLGADPYEPRNNILAGAAYLREMHDRFGPDGFLAAYNAGPGRYERYLKNGQPLPEETRNYVATLAPMIGVPGVPRRIESASIPSRLTISGAAHDSGPQLRTPSRSRFSSGISRFDNRQSAQTMTLFAIIRAAFEPASASAHTIDMTALEPPPARALNAISTAAESLRIRTSYATRSSLSPSRNVLFAGRSTHTSK